MADKQFTIRWNSCLAAILFLFLLPSLAVSLDVFNLPPVLPVAEYGNILIDRNASKQGIKPVLFSHREHRQKYTCGVCHTELGFSMEANETGIREADIRDGQYCGACHNHKIAFGVDGNCAKCHNDSPVEGIKKNTDLRKKRLPPSPYGNGIDWVESLKSGLIKPATFLRTEVKEMAFNSELLLEAEWSSISPAIFPHREHSDWMDCTMCHPDLFNIKKKTTEHFLMSEILKGNFCGVCHLSVAFPMDDCQRCHPGMEPL